MKKIALITAGGSGSRMGSNLPKQFMLLNNKPVLWHTLQAFLAAYADIHFILVLPASYMQAGFDLVNELSVKDRTTLVAGGDSRFHSVKNGLSVIQESSIVFVHDGVRCLVKPDLIKRCYQQAMELGSAIPAVAATDSIRIVEGSEHRVVNRNNVRIIQTPQTFRSELLLEAFKQQYQEIFTDEATVVECNGQRVCLIDGEYQNIKITRPVDLLVAETILQERNLF